MLVKLDDQVTVDLATRTVRVGDVEYLLTGCAHDAWKITGNAPSTTELVFRVQRASPASYGWLAGAKDDLARRIGLAWVEACDVYGMEPNPAGGRDEAACRWAERLGCRGRPTWACRGSSHASAFRRAAAAYLRSQGSCPLGRDHSLRIAPP